MLRLHSDILIWLIWDNVYVGISLHIQIDLATSDLPVVINKIYNELEWGTWLSTYFTMPMDLSSNP